MSPGTILRIAAWVGGAILAVIVVVLVANFISDPFGWKKHQLEQAQHDAAVAQGNAVVATGQVALQQDASGIREHEIQRTETTRVITNETVRTIQAAQGAGNLAGAGVVSALNGGLCKLSEYAGDPRCIEMRPSNHSDISGASSGTSSP